MFSYILSMVKHSKTQQTNDDGLTKRWREIMGENYWAGLLDPLDLVLRKELIKYGDLVVATGESFNGDIYSKNYGQCRYNTSNFFDNPLVPKVGYNVTRLLHASSHNRLWPADLPKPVHDPDWKEKSAYMGFVAVSDDETSIKLGRRDVCVSWRGSLTGIEWSADEDSALKAVGKVGMSPADDPDVQAHSGFLDMYTTKDEDNQSSAREESLKEVKRLINKVYTNEEVSITIVGHSLGGALSLLNGYDILETGAHVREGDGKKAHVCVITLAGPVVGNETFKKRVEGLGLRLLSLVNIQDPVPTKRIPDYYQDIGVVFELDSDDSNYLKPRADMEPDKPHYLEIYLHLVDGFQGKGKEFKLETGRDIALLNKRSGYLKEEHKIPPKWAVEENHGMVKNKDGLWVHP